MVKLGFILDPLGFTRFRTRKLSIVHPIRTTRKKKKTAFVINKDLLSIQHGKHVKNMIVRNYL